MEITELRVLVSGDWITFPEDILPKNQETRDRWVAVIRVAETIDECPNRNLKIAHAYNAKYGTDATVAAIRSILDRVKRKVSKWAMENTLGAVGIQEKAETKPELSADQAFDLYKKWIGWSRDVKVEAVTHQAPARLVMVVADLHGAPKQTLLPHMIDEAVTKNEEDLDVLVVYAGDIFDCFNSAGAGMVNGVPVRAAEFGEARYRYEAAQLTGFFAAATTEIKARHIVIHGNHDTMKTKFLPKGVPYWIKKTFVRDPIELLIDTFDGVLELGAWNLSFHHADGEVEHDYRRIPEAFQVGDMLVSHLNFTGAGPGDAVKKLAAWVDKNRMVFGLNHMRVLVQAHAHNLFNGDVAGGHMSLVEPGYTGEQSILKYKVGYNMWGEAGAAQGFMVCQQRLHNHEWKTDLSTIRMVRI